MSIKSTDGKIEMVLSAVDIHELIGSLKADNNFNSELTTAEMVIPKAELDTIFGAGIDLTNIKSDDKIELYEMTKEN